MDFLILVVAIIIVMWRKYKGEIRRWLKKYGLKLAALLLSLILVLTVLLTEAIQRLLDRIGKEERKQVIRDK